MSKLKLSLKVLGLAGFVVGVIWSAVIQPLRDSRNEKNFYANGFNSKVLNASSAYLGKFVEYKLDNGFFIRFYPSAKTQLEVGDSVQKDANTFKYSVYRKDVVGAYQFLGIFDYMKF